VNNYRIVLAGVFVLAVVLMAVSPFLRTNDLTNMYIGVVITLFAAAVISSLYITVLNVTSKTRPRSWVFVTVATTAWEVTLGGALVVVILLVNLTGNHLTPGLGITLLGMAFFLFLAAPITKALVIALQEHRSGMPHTRRSTDGAHLPDAVVHIIQDPADPPLRVTTDHPE
jgi:hypothetical protein